MGGEVFEGFAVALADGLDKEVEDAFGDPELCVVGRFPVVVSARGEMLGSPWAGGVGRGGEGYLVGLFFIAVDEK